MEATKADAPALHSGKEAEGTTDPEPGKELEWRAAQEAGKQAESKAAREENSEADQELGKESESGAAQEAGKQAASQAAEDESNKAESRAAQNSGQRHYSKEMPGTESETTVSEAEHEAAKPLPQQSRDQGSKIQEGACDTGISQSGDSTAASSDGAQQAECNDSPSVSQRLANCVAAGQSQGHAPYKSGSGTVKGRQRSWAGKSSLPEEMLQTALLAGLGPRAKKRQLRRQLQAALDARGCGGMAGIGTILQC